VASNKLSLTQGISA